jgi:hypothetical protein
MMSSEPAKNINPNKILFSIAGMFLLVQVVFSQKVPGRADYIEKYSGLAVSEMRRSGIPASITMAQAILESSLGKSDLATKANNHFGIKCHVGWEGREFFYDDDHKNECFRVYESVEDSFRDHSIFLLTRDRYKDLFSLDPKDYKGWARGLKAAGYATNPHYAELLIKIIEEEELYLLDNWIPPAEPRNSTSGELVKEWELPGHRPTSYPMQMYKRNRIDFVIAGPGETVESITEKMDLLRWEIRRYNELEKNEEVDEGSIVYIQPKRKQAARGFDTHIVEEGETIYSISQHYGIKTKWLLKRNNLEEGAVLQEGQRIWLRGTKPDDK